MLIKLSGTALRPLGPVSIRSFVGRVTEQADRPDEARAHEILRIHALTGVLPIGFRGYLLDEDGSQPAIRDAYQLASDWRYVADGDVVRIDPTRRSLNVLYRRASSSNAFLVTERCDNYCVMCSQPPKENDDSWVVDELEQVIPLVSSETREIGITGGEPALLGRRLAHLVDLMKHFLPTTAVHILSNGRRFADLDLAAAIADVGHPDLMFGIPIYSDLPEEHDYVMQARGAFDETIRGILNLKRLGVRVEIRFVIHADTYARMPQFATFLARNLLFVDHVALMGLEPIGFAKANIARLWIDPIDYQQELTETVRILDRAGMNTSIYNHQLCVLRPELHRFARKSISDWKNLYLDECAGCALADECGGLFASAAAKHSRAIKRLTSAS